MYVFSIINNTEKPQPPTRYFDCELSWPISPTSIEGISVVNTGHDIISNDTNGSAVNMTTPAFSSHSLTLNPALRFFLVSNLCSMSLRLLYFRLIRLLCEGLASNAICTSPVSPSPSFD